MSDRRGWIAAALLAACLLSSGLAGPATARDWRVNGRVSAGPVFTGRNVAWAASHPGGSFDLYESAQRRAPVVQRFAAPPASPGEYVAQGTFLAASEKVVALQIVTNRTAANPQVGHSSSQWQYLRGALGQSLGPIEACSTVPLASTGEIAVTGEILIRRRCDGSAEIDAPGAPAAITGNQVQTIRAAGRYAVWTEGTNDYAHPSLSADLVVYDLAADRELYRIPAPQFPGRLTSLAIQRDGKTAFTFDPNPRDTTVQDVVGWASPAEPRVHRAQLPARAVYRVRLAADRVAFTRDAAPRGFSNYVTLGVWRLTGASRVLARDAAGYGFDFDGTRVAYLRRGCAGHRISAVTASKLRPPRPLRRCRRT